MSCEPVGRNTSSSDTVTTPPTSFVPVGLSWAQFTDPNYDPISNQWLEPRVETAAAREARELREERARQTRALTAKYETATPEELRDARESLGPAFVEELRALMNSAADEQRRSLTISIGDEILFPENGRPMSMSVLVTRTGDDTLELSYASEWAIGESSELCREVIWVRNLQLPAELARLELTAAGSLTDFADLKEKYRGGAPFGEHWDRRMEAMTSDYEAQREQFLDDAARDMPRTLELKVGEDAFVRPDGVPEDLVLRIRRTGTDTFDITSATRWELMARSSANRELLWLGARPGRRGGH